MTRRKKRTQFEVLEDKVSEYSTQILNGRLLAIDPSSGGSSDPGYAYYQHGTLVRSGTIPVDGRRPVEYRLREIYETLRIEFGGTVDLLVVEKIRGRRAPAQLQWSIGVVMAACCIVDDNGQQPRAIEVPITAWKWFARQDDEYEKTDEEDAKKIGETVIAIAKRLSQ